MVIFTFIDIFFDFQDLFQVFRFFFHLRCLVFKCSKVIYNVYTLSFQSVLPITLTHTLRRMDLVGCERSFKSQETLTYGGRLTPDDPVLRPFLPVQNLLIYQLYSQRQIMNTKGVNVTRGQVTEWYECFCGSFASIFCLTSDMLDDFLG